MAEPQMLRASDARAVFHLLGECLELWDEPAAWREHLLNGAAKLLRGRVGVWTVMSPAAVRGGSVACVGWESAEEEQRYLALLEKPMEVVLPGLSQHLGRCIDEGFVALRLTEAIGRDVWRQSIGFNEFHRPANCDELVVSSAFDPVAMAIHSISVSRPVNDCAFTPRERNLLGFLHSELVELIGRRLATDDQIGRHGLSRRQRQTLDGLLAGLSEREIAARLKVAPTTIHTYIGKLYEHFGVKSRGELLSYYVARRPKAVFDGRD
ncbi:MAG TPA: helix-turn-helix transcriptional regulator [Pirellulaceae bacterium]|nr:helix-turn-helix transcriptional regulator [Pirellulaceae bacterium]